MAQARLRQVGIEAGRWRCPPRRGAQTFHDYALTVSSRLIVVIGQFSLAPMRTLVAASTVHRKSVRSITGATTNWIATLHPTHWYRLLFDDGIR